VAHILHQSPNSEITPLRDNSMKRWMLDKTSSVTVYCGDALAVLATLPDNSVHCCVTSPPYFNLRNYDMPNQIGIEASVPEYVDKLVSVFTEIRRVLHSSGTLWLNLGDSYNGSGKNSGCNHATDKQASNPGSLTGIPLNLSGFKPKDMLMIPARVAIALCDSGWYLRSKITWIKASAMTESVRDRPTNSTEDIFLLSKSRSYFYDTEAVKEKAAVEGTYRNMRNHWTLNTEPFVGSHFATFPTEIPRKAILAGTSARGCCVHCLAPYERIISRQRILRRDLPPNDPRYRPNSYRGNYADINGKGDAGYSQTSTLGWQPTCTCVEHSTRNDIQPCVVLDPFAGSGTTLLVAKQLNRRGVGIELNPEYYAIIKHVVKSGQRRSPDVAKESKAAQGYASLFGD
jgi:site-specific DNA-methyltransferase (cytosine-N4-specific)